MRNWILDHLQLIIAGAGAIAWWLNQRRQSTAQEDPPAAEQSAEQEIDLEERTRRIREQIQRKIEERARGGAPVSSAPTGAEPPVLAPNTTVPPPPPLFRRQQPTSHLELERQAEVLEQQAALAERLRQAAEMKAAALRRVQFEQSVTEPRSASAAAAHESVAGELRNPAALRRAFVLREIIGPPVALR